MTDIPARAASLAGHGCPTGLRAGLIPLTGARTVRVLAIDRAVAAATGEPLSVVRRLGFGPDEAHRREPDDLALVLDCPFCRRPIAYPGRGRSGEPAMAECDRCDVYFDFADAEVYVAEAADGERAA